MLLSREMENWPTDGERLMSYSQSPSKITTCIRMGLIAVVSSYILFQLHRAEHPEQEDLKRPKKYSITEFREELVRQPAGLEEYGQPPVFNPSTKSPWDYETVHIPQFSEGKKNCKVLCNNKAGVEGCHILQRSSV